jgi:hypothetical protein
MPVEFLSDSEAGGFGRFDGTVSRQDLDRAFFLDDADRELIEKRRGAASRLGFALQLTTVRWLGTFRCRTRQTSRRWGRIIAGWRR